MDEPSFRKRVEDVREGMKIKEAVLNAMRDIDYNSMVSDIEQHTLKVMTEINYDGKNLKHLKYDHYEVLNDIVRSFMAGSMVHEAVRLELDKLGVAPMSEDIYTKVLANVNCGGLHSALGDIAKKCMKNNRELIAEARSRVRQRLKSIHDAHS